ncbi:MAG TPA: phage baseplate protein [Thermoanaerobaculia bacterium]|nr:phage baseplate protein [Thermoanaerobaculia bacterium]
MRPLSAQELLDAWERGLGEPPVRRALLLVAAACPGADSEDLARESVGRRDARLLTLREWTFGPRLVSLASCPICAERLETSFDVADIRVASHEDVAEEPITLTVSGIELTFRLPNSADLLALTAAENVDGARRRLLGRCLLGTGADDLSEDALQAVARRMAEADPQGDVELSLICPACGHSWLAAFDIASFFWTEVDAWARVLLHEIHILASAYGWRESDILALSPWRRRSYLELIRG